MAEIAPDTGSQLNDVASAPSYAPVNLAAYVSTPVSQNEQAQALSQLDQLGDKLKLQQAQTKADLALANYKVAATQHLSDNLPFLSEADKTNLQAQILGNTGTIQDNANKLKSLQTYGQQGGPVATGTLGAVQAKNALSSANADATSGFANQPGFLQGAINQSGLGAGGLAGSFAQILTPAAPQAPATAPASDDAVPVGAALQAGSAPLSSAPALVASPFGGYTPGSSVVPGTGALARQPVVMAVPQGAAAPLPAQPAASAAGTPSPVPTPVTGPLSAQSIDPAVTSYMQGLRQAAYIDATTDAKTLEIPNYPSPGLTSTIFQRISKADGSVVSQSTPTVTKNDATRTVQRSAQDIVNLQTANNLAGNVQTALDKWTSVYGHSTGWGDSLKQLSQALSATNASKNSNGNVSVVEKSIGGIAESPETRSLVSAIQTYNQSLNKLDPNTQKEGGNSIGLSVGDLAAVDQLQGKLNGAKDYIGSRLKTYATDNISTRINPGQPAPVGASAAPAQAENTAAIPIGTQRIVNGQPAYRVQGGWSTVPPQ